MKKVVITILSILYLVLALSNDASFFKSNWFLATGLLMLVLFKLGYDCAPQKDFTSYTIEIFIGPAVILLLPIYLRLEGNIIGFSIAILLAIFFFEFGRTITSKNPDWGRLLILFLLIFFSFGLWFPLKG